MADDNGMNGSSGVVFTNVRILDGSGEYPFTGEVAVQGNRIRSVTRGSSRIGGAGSGGQTVIDGMGATLMPGLCDAHLHLSWNNAPGIDPIQMMPPEEHTLVTAEMAKLVLDAGFTMGRGAAAAKPRLDVVVRNFINRGPHSRAALYGGGAGDHHRRRPRRFRALAYSARGPQPRHRRLRPRGSAPRRAHADQIRRRLHQAQPLGRRDHRHEGGGDADVGRRSRDGRVKEAKARGKVLAAHARSSGSVKQCVRHGIQNIYHASFADEEALDMLEAAKDKHFVAPGLAWLINTARHAGEWGIKPGSPMAIAYERELEHAVETCRKMHRRGIRILIGGDYGFAWTPQGTNAKDLETFVDMLGFSPMEAIVSSDASYGGQIMGMGDELGMIKPGYLADMLLVDGDPIANIRVLQDKTRLLAIMKDGKFHKAPKMNEQRRRLIA